MHTLGRKITFGSLIRFALPTVFMLVFSSLYTIIDGIFISNFVGEDGLSSLNIVFPVINIIMGIATMFATGGSAIVAKKMGEGKKDEANQNFTFLFIVLMAVGALVTIGVLVFIDPLLSFLGAIETLYTYSYDYLFTTVMFTLVTMANLYFDFFLVTSGKANLALINSIIGGVIGLCIYGTVKYGNGRCGICYRNSHDSSCHFRFYLFCFQKADHMFYQTQSRNKAGVVCLRKRFF